MSQLGVVLVHGSMHGSWCWDRVVPHLYAQGVRALAVDLPGRGANDARPIGWAASVEVINEAIAELGMPAVVCAHSSGGLPAWLCAAANPAVQRLVLVAALVPRENEIAGRVMATIGHRVVFDGSGISLRGRADAAEIYYNDCSNETVDWAYDQLITEPLPADLGDDPAATHSEAAWRDVAMKTTYVVCSDDRALPPQCQAELAAKMAASTRFPTGHSPFLSEPVRLADLLARIAVDGM